VNDIGTSADRQEAGRYWNELLLSCADPEAVIERLRQAQKGRGFVFGNEQPFCVVARPRFVTAAEMRREHHAVTVLSRAIRKVRDAVLESDELHATYLGRFNEWIGSILELEPRFHEAWTILRFDSFLAGNAIRFVEVNGDIPMGRVCNDGLIPIFQELELFRTFEARYDVRPSLVQIGMIQTFMHAWQSWGGTGTPRMCILSFPGGLEDIFAHLNARDMEKLGIEVTAAHPEDLDFHAGKLRAKGRAVDLVYRIMHLGDCQRRSAEVAPLLEALKHEAVCMVNPFRSALVSHKYLFALLTDDTHDFHFTQSERDTIRACVPWGRILRDGCSTAEDGSRIDLVEYVMAHQDDLVLKPAHEAGGTGVHLGWACDAAQWADAVQEAVRGEYVVQRKIEVTREEYPRLEKGLALESFFEDTDPFGFPAGYSAAMNRISSAEITNVAQGGSFVPTFVIDAR
jgi:hypothetical protein